ncbi:MAG: DUF1295 domain-containing protein [Oscillospiraceae bacterium]|nr:DUF1295 domain-containing protein [Oscillospiraceae bacterium]
MKPVQSRGISFLLVTAVYLLATAVGILFFGKLPFDFWLNLLLADITATVFTFLFSLIFRNASVYDPYWSVQPLVILGGLALFRGANLLGGLLIAVVFLWGIRLTANWAYTFHGLSHQDWRYTMLREKTGPFYPVINFVGIHMVPTLIVYGCTLPAAWAIEYGVEFSPISLIGVVLSLLAVILQGSADIQMHHFRKQKTGGFIRTGLWKYSRHPNYLGEILMWWGVGVAVVCAAPELWLLLIGAVCNTVLFFAVSIPMADGRQSRKEGFARYRAETRMLLPIPKRHR